MVILLDGRFGAAWLLLESLVHSEPPMRGLFELGDPEAELGFRHPCIDIRFFATARRRRRS